MFCISRVWIKEWDASFRCLFLLVGGPGPSPEKIWKTKNAGEAIWAHFAMQLTFHIYLNLAYLQIFQRRRPQKSVDKTTIFQLQVGLEILREKKKRSVQGRISDTKIWIVEDVLIKGKKDFISKTWTRQYQPLQFPLSFQLRLRKNVVSKTLCKRVGLQTLYYRIQSNWNRYANMRVPENVLRLKQRYFISFAANNYDGGVPPGF